MGVTVKSSDLRVVSEWFKPLTVLFLYFQREHSSTARIPKNDLKKIVSKLRIFSPGDSLGSLSATPED